MALHYYKWLILVVLFGTCNPCIAQEGILFLNNSDKASSKIFDQKLCTWVKNDYSYKNEKIVYFENKDRNTLDSLRAVYRICVEMPLLYPIGKPVFSYSGGAYDNVYWIDKNGNSMGRTSTPTFYANPFIQTGSYPYMQPRDSFNPWGTNTVGQALLGGIINYALNGFKTPNYKQNIQYNPNIINPFQFRPSIYGGPFLNIK